MPVFSVVVLSQILSMEEYLLRVMYLLSPQTSVAIKYSKTH